MIALQPGHTASSCRAVAIATLLIGAPWAAAASDEATRLAVDENEATITVSQDGAPILVYNKQPLAAPRSVDPVFERSGNLHPVFTPRQRIVTGAFPVDHRHQHGIFTAWVDTTYDGRQIDFWNLVKRTGRVLHERTASTFASDDGAGFEVDLVHRIVAEPQVDVLREHWKVAVRPTDGSFRCFDLLTTQTALTDKPLVVNKYVYGGVAVRGRQRWLTRDVPGLPEEFHREPTSLINSNRSERIKGNHEHANWVALSGEIDGAPVSVALLCHPDNFRAPQAARLHPTSPYFCFAPCVDGAFVIDKQHPYQGRYRFIVTDAGARPEQLDRLWQKWTGEDVQR